MGLFKKGIKNDFEDGHNNSLFSDDDDYIAPMQHRMVTGERKISAPHAITADELSGTVENIPMQSHERPVANSVYESMREHEKHNRVTAIEDDYVPSWANKSAEETDFSQFSDRAKFKSSSVDNADAAKRAEEILKSTNVRTESAPYNDKNDLDSEEGAVVLNIDETTANVETNPFLERCKKAVLGEAEEPRTSPIKVPMFKTEPVERETAQPQAQKTDDFDAVIRRLRGEEEPVENNTEPKIEVEIIPEDAPAEIMYSETNSDVPVEPEEPANDVKVYGKVINGKVVQETPDGTIDVGELIKAQRQAEEELGATRMFDGLDDVISQKADDSFNEAQEIYNGEDENQTEEISYYETEDSDLSDIEDYNDINDAADIKTSLQANLSAQSIRTTVSFIVFVVMLLLSLPIMDLLPVKAGGFISILLLVVSIAVNLDVFNEFKRITKVFRFDCAVAVTSVAALVQTAVSAFVYDGAFGFLAAYAALLLAVNRYMKRAKVKRLALGVEKIANLDTKSALFVSDSKASKIIASGAVEGEVVGIVSKPAVNVRGFIKSSNYKTPFDLKFKILFIVGMSVSAAAGVVAGIIAGFGAGLTFFTAMLCCAFPISACLSSEMPMNRIANRLAEKGAALAGFKGAFELNRANIVSVNTSDLFPEGTVKLYNMKTLGKNELGPTLLAAAAVAIAANSPLAGIFREMVGVSSENEMPKVNGVQYEDKMGISGWIGANTVLIGNRNLMQGHNIPVPPSTVDKKILRAGYFPVYIAFKGSPCLLFVVKYEVDEQVKAELARLCNTGMTVLVNPQDPNASQTMICDYFSIPDDALKVMNHNARVVYEKEARFEENVTAPAVGGDNVTGKFAAITSAIKLSSIVAVLTAVYVVAAVLGAILLIYLGIIGKLSLITSFALTVFQVVFMIISSIAMKVKDR